jgi:hypothetical protein
MIDMDIKPRMIVEDENCDEQRRVNKTHGETICDFH